MGEYRSLYALYRRFPVHRTAVAKSVFAWSFIGRCALVADAGMFGADLAVGGAGAAGSLRCVGLAGGGPDQCGDRLVAVFWGCVGTVTVGQQH